MAGAVLLGVLSRIPETVNPRLYGGLLPKVSAKIGCTPYTHLEPALLPVLAPGLTASPLQPGN